MHYILAINPGSTTTKVALYEEEREIFNDCKNYTYEELKKFSSILEQFELRKEFIAECIEKSGIKKESLSAVVGRGGILPPIRTGGYFINEEMKEHVYYHAVMQHASSLGALLADAFAKELSIPAYIYDAATSDELSDIARVTGFPEIKRQSIAHVLNSRAVARIIAKRQGKRYEDMNFVVAHMGGGISISAHNHGKMIDTVADDGGPFAPDRSGSVNLMYLVEICYSGLYQKDEVLRKVRGAGGIKAHLGTHDCREVERMIAEGNEYAKLIYEAEGLQIAKGIGCMLGVFEEPVDAVILTGGMANSKMLMDMIVRRIKHLVRVEIYPGEKEMEALAFGALRILRGEESAREFHRADYEKYKNNFNIKF